MKIALSTDHAGFTQLAALMAELGEQGHECVRFGPERQVPDDDYPDFIAPAAKAVSSGECERGIIMGGSGQGEAIAANRFDGVRCAVYYGPALAWGAVDAGGHTSTDPYEILKLSRAHNDANMLSIGVRFVNAAEIKKVALLWLSEPFSGEDNHQRRILKLDKLR